MNNFDTDYKILIDVLKYTSDIIVTLTEKLIIQEEKISMIENKINLNYEDKKNMNNNIENFSDKKEIKNNNEDEIKNNLILETLINRKKELDKKLLELSNYQNNLKNNQTESQIIPESINTCKIDSSKLETTYTTKETLINRRKNNFGRRI